MPTNAYNFCGPSAPVVVYNATFCTSLHTTLYHTTRREPPNVAPAYTRWGKTDPIWATRLAPKPGHMLS